MFALPVKITMFKYKNCHLIFSMIKVYRFLPVEKRLGVQDYEDFTDFSEPRKPKRRIPVLYMAS